MNKEDKTGIFLTGGGGIGPFHIGFFKALEELGIKYDVVCGGSVGAIVGGASTYLTADEMMNTWHGLTLESVLKIDSNKIKGLKDKKRNLMLMKECILSCARKDPNLMIDINDIRKLLYDKLDGEKIKNSNIDFGLTTTVLPSFKLQQTFKEDMTTNPLEYILASLYMPVFSPQRIIDNKYYIDLTRYRRYPIEMLKEKQCNKIYIVNLETHNLNKFYKPISKYFTNNEEVSIISYDNFPSVLDFSEEMAEINYKNGYEITMSILQRKRH